MINDPAVLDAIYSVKNDFPKSENQKTWLGYKNGEKIPGLASTQDKQEHGRLRKPVAAAYSMTNLAGLEPYVNQTIRYFVKRLNEEFISNNKACDIDNWLQYCKSYSPYSTTSAARNDAFTDTSTDAYDVIGELTFGRRLGFLEAGGDTDGSLADLNDEFSYRATVSNMPWIDYLVRRNAVMLRLRNYTSRFTQRAGAHIAARMRSGAPDPTRRDLLAHFLEAQKAHPDIVTQNVLAGYTVAPLLAGSDTTGVLLRSVLYFCLRNPRVLARLRAELVSTSADRELPVSYQKAIESPYLDAVIREASRHHAIGPGPLKRVVPDGHPGLVLPNGVRLPPGTTVGMAYYTLGKNKAVYGEDADVFLSLIHI